MPFIKKAMCFLALLLTISSCAPYYVGLKFPEDERLQRFDFSRKMFKVLDQLVLKYDLEVDTDEKKYNVSGTVKINSTEFTGAWDVDEITIYFYLLDKDKIIKNRERVIVFTSGNVVDDYIPFSGSFDYSPEYIYVAHRYEARVSL